MDDLGRYRFLSAPDVSIPVILPFRTRPLQPAAWLQGALSQGFRCGCQRRPEGLVFGVVALAANVTRCRHQPSGTGRCAAGSRWDGQDVWNIFQLQKKSAGSQNENGARSTVARKGWAGAEPRLSPLVGMLSGVEYFITRESWMIFLYTTCVVIWYQWLCLNKKRFFLLLK
jgi:hypothetical protein